MATAVVDPAQLQTVLDVLNEASKPGDAAVEIREALLPAIQRLMKRHRQHERQIKRAAAKQEEEQNQSQDAQPAQLACIENNTTLQTSPSCVVVESTHLSRPLYMNPVCMLSTWTLASEGRPARRNLMTISWLTPLDNDGRFICSMVQRRYSASLLQANHGFFGLSVATEALVPQVLKIGGCRGEWLQPDKPSVLGIDLCRPGWQPIESNDTKSEAQPFADEPMVWPEEGFLELPGVDSFRTADILGNAFCVAPCAAHICARVVSVRGAYGHFILFCETVSAHVRSEYWSKKRTLEPQSSQLSPVLTFFGSQRFGRVQSLDMLTESKASSHDAVEA
eukprot:TRINITY_DN65565_c0_g1_i1.p1 TRINITY_DN65565_c0_g1~~TRINITY_DN65565_c0_g1_i1.p1  ORF type:complete len:353 (+),score=42.64 TRINITY_DN65565_c0_g1_i1:54-1061(+)